MPASILQTLIATLAINALRCRQPVPLHRGSVRLDTTEPMLAVRTQVILPVRILGERAARVL